MGVPTKEQFIIAGGVAGALLLVYGFILSIFGSTTGIWVIVLGLIIVIFAIIFYVVATEGIDTEPGAFSSNKIP